MARKFERAGSVRRTHIAAGLIGLWMVIAPFVLSYGRASATVSELIAGLIILALSSARLRTFALTWASWALAGMGVWLVFSPFIFGYSRAATYWNELLFGIVLVVLMFSALGSNIRHHSHLAH